MRWRFYISSLYFPCFVQIFLEISVVILTNCWDAYCAGQNWSTAGNPSIFPLFFFFFSCVEFLLLSNPSIPSGAERRFNCKICIVTQQTNSPVSCRPLAIAGFILVINHLFLYAQPWWHFILKRLVQRNDWGTVLVGAFAFRAALL